MRRRSGHDEETCALLHRSSCLLRVAPARVPHVHRHSRCNLYAQADGEVHSWLDRGLPHSRRVGKEKVNGTQDPKMMRTLRERGGRACHRNLLWRTLGRSCSSTCGICQSPPCYPPCHPSDPRSRTRSDACELPKGGLIRFRLRAPRFPRFATSPVVEIATSESFPARSGTGFGLSALDLV